MRKRWPILTLCFVVYASVLSWIATLIAALIFAPTDEWTDVVRFMFMPSAWHLDEPVWWMIIGIPVGVILITQFLFLLPVVRVVQPRGGRARSLRLTTIMAGFVAAVLSFGLAAGIVGLVQLLTTMHQPNGDPADADFTDGEFAGIAVLTFAVLSWIIWSFLLMNFARRRQGRGVVGRIIGLLLGGTIIEVLVVLPVDIMIRRRTDCYCGTGTFYTLTLSAWALLWLTGPGIVVALRSRRRDAWWATHCEGCGYEKGPTPGANCPECGHSWIHSVAA